MKELRDQLWDLVYGLLDEADAARLREQITSDRHVAREYARVKLQSELVGQVARAKQVERDFPTLGERPSPATLDRAWSPARRIAFTGSLALSLGLLLFAGSVYWSDQTSLRGPNVAQRVEEFQKEAPRLLVVGPDELQRDATNTFDVTLETLGGEALVAPIEASLQDLDGNMVWYESSQTNADGKRQVHLPADKLQGEALLLKIRVDEASAADGSDNASGAELKTWLSVNEPRDDLVVMNHVSSGEQLYFRQAELRSRRYAETSKAVDEVAETVGEKKKSGGSRREADVALADDADRVRWGVDDSEPRRLNKFNLAPSTDDAKQRKDVKEDASKSTRNVESKQAQPLRQPVSPKTESQAAPPAPAPVTDAPSPEEAAPARPALPGTTAGAGSKKELPAQTPAPSNTPVAKPLPKLQQVERFREEEQFREKEQSAIQRDKALEKGRQVLVESITAGDNVVASRLVDGIATEATLQARIDQARNEGLIPADFSGQLTVTVFDPAVAPPQKLAETTFEVGPAVEPLSCTIRFDRNEYRAGDIAEAEVRVSTLDGLGIPAVLNVQVDEVPLAESDAEDQPVPTLFLYANTETPRLPLVFDNAAEQAQQVNQSLSGWVAERQVSRRHSALWLLGGSGFGFCLLLAAGSLKWLPQARFWLPVAALLACSATLGASWLQEVPTAADEIAAADPLTTHGVQSEPPARELTTAPSNEQFLERKTMDEKLSPNDFADMPLAKDDRLAPTAETDVAQPATDRQTLLGMADWDQLAQRGSISGYATNGRVAGGADDLSQFRGDGKDFRLGARINELVLKEWSDLPRGRPGASSAVDAVDDPSGSRTLSWHPRLTADKDGICRVQFPVPQSRLALRLVVLSHSGQKVGSASKLIPTVVDVSGD